MKISFGFTTKLHAKIKELEHQIELLKKDYSAHIRKTGTLLDEKKTLAQEFDNLLKDKNDILERYNELFLEQKKLKKELLQFNEENKRLSNQYQDINKKNTELLEQINTLKTSIKPQIKENIPDNQGKETTKSPKQSLRFNELEGHAGRLPNSQDKKNDNRILEGLNQQISLSNSDLQKAINEMLAKNALEDLGKITKIDASYRSTGTSDSAMTAG
jgi:chromosome segregation ATPase